MNSTFLFRGINETIFNSDGGKLLPRKLFQPFEYLFMADGSIKGDGNATFGPSEQNAIYGHQLDSKKFLTSGVSTTPFFERARYYATGGCKFSGYVFKISREIFIASGGSEYIVSEWVTEPQEPEDQEVILVDKEQGAIPKTAMIEVTFIDIAIPTE